LKDRKLLTQSENFQCEAGTIPEEGAEEGEKYAHG
jgi:hypothetical protein